MIKQEPEKYDEWIGFFDKLDALNEGKYDFLDELSNSESSEKKEDIEKRLGETEEEIARIEKEFRKFQEEVGGEKIAEFLEFSKELNREREERYQEAKRLR